MRRSIMFDYDEVILKEYRENENEKLEKERKSRFDD